MTIKKNGVRWWQKRSLMFIDGAHYSRSPIDNATKYLREGREIIHCITVIMKARKERSLSIWGLKSCLRPMSYVSSGSSDFQMKK